jgi:hypothetical protein
MRGCLDPAGLGLLRPAKGCSQLQFDRRAADAVQPARGAGVNEVARGRERGELVATADAGDDRACTTFAQMN